MDIFLIFILIAIARSHYFIIIIDLNFIKNEIYNLSNQI
jgi:hypothetical protein